MILKIFVDEHEHDIHVPDDIVTDASEYFDMIDKDMDQGYQMSRSWIENPDLMQRCQIVGDRILTALETDNKETGTLMAAYILSRVPNAYALHLNTEDSRDVLDSIYPGKYDVVLLDLNIPYLSGKDLILPLLVIDPKICIIIISAMDHKDTIEE
ncbi:hypothetical protein GQR58_006872 [Nymphon striatum]|nr:hypothetical protein GQR58_006872 [Nymphon striatum]